MRHVELPYEPEVVAAGIAGYLLIALVIYLAARYFKGRGVLFGSEDSKFLTVFAICWGYFIPVMLTIGLVISVLYAIALVLAAGFKRGLKWFSDLGDRCELRGRTHRECAAGFPSVQVEKERDAG